MIDNVGYDAPREMNSTHSGWKNLTSNILRLPEEERVYKEKRCEPGFRLLLCPEQINTAWMKDITQKLRKLGNIIMDACPASLSAAKESMLLPTHRRFIGCEADPRCVTEVKPQLILLFA